MTAPTNQHQACDACEKPATQGWQRYATDELEAARTDPTMPSVQEHETSALVQVLACDEHALEPDLAAKVHNAECPAPVEPCSCFPDGTPA